MNIDINLIYTYFIYLFEISVFVIVGMLLNRLINSNKNKENKMVKKQAFTDQLTGRGNRYMFQAVLDKLILKKKKFAVCFMDLDGFKQMMKEMNCL